MLKPEYTLNALCWEEQGVQTGAKAYMQYLELSNA